MPYLRCPKCKLLEYVTGVSWINCKACGVPMAEERSPPERFGPRDPGLAHRLGGPPPAPPTVQATIDRVIVGVPPPAPPDPPPLVPDQDWSRELAAGLEAKRVADEARPRDTNPATACGVDLDAIARELGLERGNAGPAGLEPDGPLRERIAVRQRVDERVVAFVEELGPIEPPATVDRGRARVDAFVLGVADGLTNLHSSAERDPDGDPARAYVAGIKLAGRVSAPPRRRTLREVAIDLLDAIADRLGR